MSHDLAVSILKIAEEMNKPIFEIKVKQLSSPFASDTIKVFATETHGKTTVTINVKDFVFRCKSKVSYMEKISTALIMAGNEKGQGCSSRPAAGQF